MNGKAQLAIGRVVYLVVSERDVANGQVEEVPAVRGFKTGHGNVCVGIELLCDPAGDAVQLHAKEPGFRHFLREKTEEIADAHGGLQDVARLEAHAADGLIHGLDDRGRGIVRVERGRSCGGVFLRAERCIQLPELIGPSLLSFIESVGKTAPADIPEKYLLLLRRCASALKLQLVQKIDGVHVAAKLHLRPALAKMIVRDAEVLCGGNGSFSLLRQLRLRRGYRLDHDVIGQAVLYRRIDGGGRAALCDGLCCRDNFLRFFRCVLIWNIPRKLIGIMGKAVPLLLVHRAENGNDLIPGEEQLCAVFVLKLDLETVFRRKVVRFLAADQTHGVGDSGIGVRHAAGNPGIVLSVEEICGNLRFVAVFQKSAVAHKHIL